MEGLVAVVTAGSSSGGAAGAERAGAERAGAQQEELPKAIWQIADLLPDQSPPWPIRHPEALVAYRWIADTHPQGNMRKIAKKAVFTLDQP